MVDCGLCGCSITNISGSNHVLTQLYLLATCILTLILCLIKSTCYIVVVTSDNMSGCGCAFLIVEVQLCLGLV